MKKFHILILFFILFIFETNARIYDFIKENYKKIFNDFYITQLKELNFKLNGNKLKVSIYESFYSAKEILNYYYKVAEKKKSTFYNNENIFEIASTIYDLISKNKYEEEFGYILFKDNKNIIKFIIVGGENNKSEIIEIILNNITKKEWCDDNLLHFNDIEKIVSLEILQKDKTINFINCYRIYSSEKQEIKNFYESIFKKLNYKIIKKFAFDDCEIYLIVKENKNYLISIIEDYKENFLIIIG